MKHFLFNFFLLISFGTASAQTADAIIEKHLSIRGAGALDSVKTARMELEVIHKNAPSMKSQATYSSVMMQSHRIDLRVPYLYETVICFSGDRGWGLLKRDGKTELTRMDSATVQELKYQTEILGPLYQYQQKGYTVEYLGREVIDESVTFILKVNAAHNTTYHCFIDSQTLLEVKRTVLAPNNGQMISVELYFSEYRPVKCILMPFKIEMRNRKGTTYFNFQEIEFNTNFDPRLFEIPSGG